MRLRRLGALVFAAGTVAVGAFAPGADAQTAALEATFVPCGSTSGPCDAAPDQLEVTYPAGQAPAAVEITWLDGASRPKGAPQPDSSDEILSMAGTTSCAVPPPATTTTTSGPVMDTACWDWPSGLRYQAQWILNGSYRVTACSSYQGTACTPSGAYQPALVALAVPPPPPGGVAAAPAGRQVTVSWKAPAAPPPDLDGYTVIRNGRDIYTCTLFATGSDGNVACPQPLRFTDQPGAGSWVYRVESLRLGAGGQYPPVVASAPAGAAKPVLVSPPPSTTTTTSGAAGPPASGSGGSSARALLPPVPVIGALAGRYPGIASGAGSAALPGQGESGLSTGPVQNLSYPSLPAPAAGALTVREAGPSGPDVVPAAMLAAALLILALAAHLLYLRTLADARRLRPSKVG